MQLIGINIIRQVTTNQAPNTPITLSTLRQATRSIPNTPFLLCDPMLELWQVDFDALVEEYK